jgi:hypothetical protein
MYGDYFNKIRGKIISDKSSVDSFATRTILGVSEMQRN